MQTLVEQLRELSQLHQDGSLSDDEFEAAKARLLDGSFSPQNDSTPLLALQNELAALDRQWTIKREQYRVQRRYHSFIPEEGQGKTSGAAITIFGGIWTLVTLFIAATASGSGAPGGMVFFLWIFPLVGVLFIISGLSTGAEMERKAGDYKTAEDEYWHKRAQLESRIKALM